VSAKTLSYVRRDLPTVAGGGTRAAVKGMLAAYLVLILASLFLFHSHLVMVHGNEMSFDRTLFTAVNAATLTGFQQTIGVREFNAAGGAGVAAVFVLMLAGMLFSFIAGGLAVVRIARLPYTDRQVVTSAMTAVALATLAGGACLANGGRSVWDAVFLSASAFGNSGLYIGQLVPLNSAATFVVLLPLAVLGGLGLPVLMELFDLTFGRLKLSAHSRVVLSTSAIVYLFGLLILFVIQLASATSWSAWRDALGLSSVAAVNARTFGLPVGSVASFAGAAQWVMMLLMLIGGSPAGSAGGLKATTPWHLVRGVRSALRGEGAGRPLGIAIVWVAIYLLILFVGFLLLLGAVPQIPPDRLLFLSISAIGNVGLSHDPVSITGPGLAILSALMLAGRLAPIGILWWMVDAAPEAEVAIA